MMSPPRAPRPRIGAQALVMTADGMLRSSPKTSPTVHEGHGNAATPITRPMANRSTKAAVSAERLSGKDSGSIERTASVPNTMPAVMPYVRCVMRLK